MRSAAAVDWAAPRSPKGEVAQAPADAFHKDILHLLQRYASGVDDALNENLLSLAEPRGYKPSSPRTSVPSLFSRRKSRESFVEGRGSSMVSTQQAEARARQEERAKIMKATERYRLALAKEHQRFMSGRQELIQGHVEVRKQELEMAKRHYGDNCEDGVKQVVDKQLATYLEQLKPRALTDELGNVTNPDIEAKREWCREVCKVVVQDVRQEWRTSQKKILLAIARELRHEHQAAADILEKNLMMWQLVTQNSQTMWECEVIKAQEQLEKLAEGYKKALEVLYEAELREVRQHITEQVDFFLAEIREAQKAEQEEGARNAAEIERMQTAVQKWNAEYVKDAERKARDIAGRRRLIHLDGIDPFDGEGDNDEAPAMHKNSKTVAASKSVGFDFGEDGGDSDRDEIEEQAERMADDLMAQVGMPATRQRNIQAAVKRAMKRRILGQPAAHVLQSSRRIIGEIHEKLPADPVEVREFLLKVESRIPITGDVLRLYEEHLAEHGIMVAVATYKPPSSNSEEQLQQSGAMAAVGAHRDQEVTAPEPPPLVEGGGLSPKRRQLAQRGKLVGRGRGRG